MERVEGGGQSGVLGQVVAVDDAQLGGGGRTEPERGQGFPAFGAEEGGQGGQVVVLEQQRFRQGTERLLQLFVEPGQFGPVDALAGEGRLVGQLQAEGGPQGRLQPAGHGLKVLVLSFERKRHGRSPQKTTESAGRVQTQVTEPDGVRKNPWAGRCSAVPQRHSTLE